MEFLYNYFNDSTNYKITNINNIYNTFIEILETVDDETKEKIISIIKIQIGMTFSNNLKMYIFRKLGNKSELLDLF